MHRAYKICSYESIRIPLADLSSVFDPYSSACIQDLPKLQAICTAHSTHLGQDEFKAREIKERGIKVDLGTTKIKIPVTDDQGNPIHDAEGNVVLKDKTVKLAKIGTTILDKFDKLEELLKLPGDNQLEILANLSGILDIVDTGILSPQRKELLSRAINEAQMDTAQEMKELTEEKLAQDDRFIVNLGPNVRERRINKKKIKLIIGTIMEKAIRENAQGADASGTPLTLSKPVINIRGEPIFLSSLDLRRNQVLDVEAVDATGRFAPRIFNTIGDARRGVAQRTPR